MVRRHRWWLVGAGLLFGVAVATWFSPRQTTRSLRDMFSRVRVGMSQDEALAVLRTFKPDTDGLFSFGATNDGSFARPLNLVDPYSGGLPLPQEIKHCRLTIIDCEGREVEIILGQGGTVTDKRFISDRREDWWFRICSKLSR